MNTESMTNSLKHNRGKIFVAVVLLIALPLTLNWSNPGSVDGTGESEEGFNRADIMFMNMMIVHHDQAIEMAELAPNRTENENILELSSNISEAQRAENEKMADWLRENGLQRPTGGHRMAGMASEENMSRLENSEGREFDVLFSELMITHHRGGIQMAKTFSERGRNSELIALEKEMIDAQEEEIKKMQEWRQDWR